MPNGYQQDKGFTWHVWQLRLYPLDLEEMLC